MSKSSIKNQFSFNDWFVAWCSYEFPLANPIDLDAVSVTNLHNVYRSGLFVNQVRALTRLFSHMPAENVAAALTNAVPAGYSGELLEYVLSIRSNNSEESVKQETAYYYTILKSYIETRLKPVMRKCTKLILDDIRIKEFISPVYPLNKVVQKENTSILRMSRDSLLYYKPDNLFMLVSNRKTLTGNSRCMRNNGYATLGTRSIWVKQGDHITSLKEEGTALAKALANNYALAASTARLIANEFSATTKALKSLC